MEEQVQYVRHIASGKTIKVGMKPFEFEEGYEVVLGFPPSDSWADYVLPPKPKLQGAALVSFLRGLFKDRTLAEREAILAPLQLTLDVVKEDPEISLEDFAYIRTKLSAVMAPVMHEEQIRGVEASVNEFLTNFEVS